MHVHKSSFYSTAIATQLRNGNATDQSPKRPLPEAKEGRSSERDRHQEKATADQVSEKLRNELSALKKLQSATERKAFTLNPQLDRRAQAALNNYQSLQSQNEKEERESISRLLGIDLYV